jgi:hypothetical protein
MAIVSIQPLTEMSTRNPSEGIARPVPKADLTDVCQLIIWKLCDSIRPHNSIGLHALLQGQILPSYVMTAKKYECV